MHSKLNSTQFGEPLSKESITLIQQVRQKLTYPINPNFNTDFNIYRFVANAERNFKTKMEVVENAAKALSMHLRVRKCFDLDELPDIPFEKNPIFIERLMPMSPILENATDSFNRLLWFVEYKSLNVEAIANGIRSSESIKFQFWQFEHMLKLVNRQEELTGRLSSIRHVIDMTGYEINPFTMLFVSSGTLSYYSQLLHYDNYPDLVYPIEMVNIAKWIYIPYRLIKSMMPVGFVDRFRLHDANFLENLCMEINLDYIPHSLGGQNQSIYCVPMQHSTQNWQPMEPRVLNHLEHLSLGPRKYKFLKIQIDPNTAKKHFLSWYFRTDGIIQFGVFFEPLRNERKENKQNGKYLNGHNNGITIPTAGTRPSIEYFENNMEWVYMWFKLTAKIHHEWDSVECTHPGIYWIIFSNCHSWIHKRYAEVIIQLAGEENGQTNIKRIWHDKREEVNNNLEDYEDLRKIFQMKIKN